MSNFYKVNTLVLSRQFLTATGNDIFVNGILYGVNHFDSGNAAASGQILINDINSLSGFTTGLSGFSSANYATILNLTATGVIIETQINSLSGFSTGSSGFLQNQVNTLFINLTSTGQVLYNDILGLSGLVNNTITNLTATGVAIESQIAGLSGIVNNIFAGQNIVYTSGNQNITGIKYFATQLNAQNFALQGDNSIAAFDAYTTQRVAFVKVAGGSPILTYSSGTPNGFVLWMANQNGNIPLGLGSISGGSGQNVIVFDQQGNVQIGRGIYNSGSTPILWSQSGNFYSILNPSGYITGIAGTGSLASILQLNSLSGQVGIISGALQSEINNIFAGDNLVYLTGNQLINGNKSFTGQSSFVTPVLMSFDSGNPQSVPIPQAVLDIQAVVSTTNPSGLIVRRNTTQYLHIHQGGGGDHVIEAVGNVPVIIQNDGNSTTQVLRIGRSGQPPGLIVDGLGNIIANQNGNFIGNEISGTNFYSGGIDISNFYYSVNNPSGFITSGFVTGISNELINVSGMIGSIGFFTPLSTGWYRLISGSPFNHVAGRLLVYTPTNTSPDFNVYLDEEIWADINGYNNVNTLSWVRHSAYGGGVGIGAIRAGADGAGTCTLDILMTNTGQNPIGLKFISARGDTQFLSNITSGAAFPATGVTVLTPILGLSTSQNLVVSGTATIFQTLILSGQSIAAIPGQLLVDGAIPYDFVGTAANTGQILYTNLTGLSGTLINYATNSFVTTVATNSTNNALNLSGNLTQTGIILENQINVLSGFVTGVSGYLSTHGSVGSNVQVTGSTIISSPNFTGVNNTTVSYVSGYIVISSTGGAVGSFDPLGTAANTGQILYNQINSLSGFVTGVSGYLSSHGSSISPPNLVYTTGNQSITGNLSIAGFVNIGSITSPNYAYNIAYISSGSTGYPNLIIQNPTTSSGASADYVVNSDSGNNLLYYIDVGINNSIYYQTGVNLPLMGTGFDGYIFVQGNTGALMPGQGNLYVGTVSTGTKLFLFAGNYSGSPSATVDSTGINLPAGYTYRIGNNNIQNLFDPTGSSTTLSGFLFQGLSTGISANYSEIPFYTTQGILSGDLKLAYSSTSTLSELILGTGGTGGGAGAQCLIIVNGSNIVGGAAGISFQRNSRTYGIVGTPEFLGNANSFDFGMIATTGLILGSNGFQTLYLDSGNNGIFSNNLTVSGTIAPTQGFTTGINAVYQQIAFYSAQKVLSGDLDFTYANSVMRFGTGGTGNAVSQQAASPVMVFQASNYPTAGGAISFTRNLANQGGIGSASQVINGGMSSYDMGIGAVSGLYLGSNNFTPTLYLDTGNNGTFTNSLTVSGSLTLSDQLLTTTGNNLYINGNSVGGAGYTGAYIPFCIQPNFGISGLIENQFIPFSGTFGSVPMVNYSIINNSGDAILAHYLSGVSTSGFNIVFSAAPQTSNYNISFMATTGMGFVYI